MSDRKMAELQKVLCVSGIFPSLSGNHSIPRSPAHRILPHPTDWKLVAKLSGSLERELCDFARFGFYQKRRDWIAC